MIDSNPNESYNQSILMQQALSQAVSLGFTLGQMNLDSGISQAFENVPLMEGDSTMAKYTAPLTINGIKKWIRADSLQEIANSVIQICGSGTNQQSPQSAPMFSDYIWTWFETYKVPKLKPNTAEDYRSKISKHLIPFFGDRRLNEITTADIQHFYTAKTNYAHSTVHCMGIILHQLFDSAKEDGFYQGMNPTESKRLTMSTKKKEREALTMDEVQEIIGNLDKLDPESKLLVMVLLHTGGRRGEALGLRWEDIDFERRTIHLNRDIDFVSNQPVIDDKMKSKAAHRYIPLDDTLYTLLQSIREREGFIFNRDGKPWTERIYMRRWNKIRRVICSKDITAHMIRHTYATTLIGNHTDVKTVSALLGHADTQTTLNIYTHPITQNLQNAGVLLDSIYQQKPTKIADKIA